MTEPAISWTTRHEILDSGPIARELGMRSASPFSSDIASETVGQLDRHLPRRRRLHEGGPETLELLSVVLSSALSHASEFESKQQQVEALARFETMYQGAAIGITLHVPEGHSFAANPAFEEMFGYTEAELATMTCGTTRIRMTSKGTRRCSGR